MFWSGVRLLSISMIYQGAKVNRKAIFLWQPRDGVAILDAAHTCTAECMHCTQT